MWKLNSIRSAACVLCSVCVAGLGFVGCMQPSHGRRVITEPAPPLLEGKTSQAAERSPSEWRDPRDDSEALEAKSPKGAAELARDAALAAAGSASPSNGRSYSPSDELLIKDVHAVMDDWHSAAAVGDRDRYLAHFAQDAIFMGTDPTERWDLATFSAYVREHFKPGAGWTFQPSNRHIMLSSGSDMAWFDEQLDSEGANNLRGTGVLRRDGEVWKIVHYSMVFTVPTAVQENVKSALRSGR